MYIYIDKHIYIYTIVGWKTILILMALDMQNVGANHGFWCKNHADYDVSPCQNHANNHGFWCKIHANSACKIMLLTMVFDAKTMLITMVFGAKTMLILHAKPCCWRWFLMQKPCWLWCFTMPITIVFDAKTIGILTFLHQFIGLDKPYVHDFFYRGRLGICPKNVTRTSL